MVWSDKLCLDDGSLEPERTIANVLLLGGYVWVGLNVFVCGFECAHLHALHPLVEPCVGVVWCHLPARAARAHELDNARSAFCYGVLECATQCFLGMDDALVACDALAADEACALCLAQELCYGQRITVQLDRAAVGACHCLHPERSGGGHLAACHSIDRIVDEDDGYVLASVAGVDDLGRANGGQLAIALIGEDHLVGIHAADACGHCRGAAMGGLHPVYVYVVIYEHRASHRADANHFVVHPHVTQDVCDHLVYGGVRAAGAVVHVCLGHHPRAAVYYVAV